MNWHRGPRARVVHDFGDWDVGYHGDDARVLNDFDALIEIRNSGDKRSAYTCSGRVL